MTYEIIIGIATSIITWVIIKFYNMVLLPEYEAIVYKEIKINGTWISNLVDQNITYNEEYTFVQKGHNITGVYKVINIFNDGNSNITSEYKIQGKISNGFLNLSGQITSQSEIGMISFIFKVTNSGNTLVGNSIWISRHDNNIESYNNHSISRK